MQADSIIQSITLITLISIAVLFVRNRKHVFTHQTLAYPIALWVIHSTIFYSVVLLDDLTLFDFQFSLHDWSAILRLSLALSILISLTYTVTIEKASKCNPKQ